MQTMFNRVARLAPWCALALFALALLGAGLGVPEYVHRLHPVGLRGAAGLPGAALFNLVAFMAPAVLLVLAAHAWRERAPAPGWGGRIGLVLVQLSALAFGAQGAAVLDPSDMEATGSRLHALAWMLWWIAFVPGALLMAAGARRGRALAVASLAAAVLVPLLAAFAPIGAWVGLAQRLAYLAWFGWWLVAARAFTRA